VRFLRVVSFHPARRKEQIMVWEIWGDQPLAGALERSEHPFFGDDDKDDEADPDGMDPFEHISDDDDFPEEDD